VWEHYLSKGTTIESEVADTEGSTATMSTAHMTRSTNHRSFPYLLTTYECLEQRFGHCQQMKTKTRQTEVSLLSATSTQPTTSEALPSL
jgi:hypothetical protein